MAYKAESFKVDFETPRMRNLGLYAISILAGTGLGLVAGCFPIGVLFLYGVTFDLINPDMFNFDEKGVYVNNIKRKDLLLKPIVQPFKDIVNLVRLRKARF
jgi:hypothetical protein